MRVLRQGHRVCSCHSEVGYLQTVRLLARDQDILGLQVSVDDAVRVQELYASSQLQAEVANNIWLQRASGSSGRRIAKRAHMLLQVLIDELEDKVDSPEIDEDIKELHHIRMVRVPQYSNLADRSARYPLLLVHGLHLLHCYSPASLRASALVNSPICSFPD